MVQEDLFDSLKYFPAWVWSHRLFWDLINNDWKIGGAVV